MNKRLSRRPVLDDDGDRTTALIFPKSTLFDLRGYHSGGATPPITAFEVPPDDEPDDKEKEYKAIGVEYEQNGIVKKAYLKSSILRMDGLGFAALGVRSVILTAGALMTPKLLMNSGIGSSEVLEKAGVKVLVDSPMVGRNLQDQPAVGMTFTQGAIAAAGEHLCGSQVIPPTSASPI